MLTCPTQPKEALSPRKISSPGRTHQLGNILRGLQAAQMPQTRVGEVTGLSQGLEAGRQSRGESGLGSAGAEGKSGTAPDEPERSAKGLDAG